MAVAEAITLAYKMTQGESLRYRIGMDSDQQVQEGDKHGTVVSRMDLVMSQKAKSVAPDGTLSLDVIIDTGTVKRNGEATDLPNVGQTISMTMKKTGEVTQTSVDFPFSQPPFPDKPVKVGDTWTGQSTLNVLEGKPPITLTYHYTLKGIKKIHGYECAEIDVKSPVSTHDLGEGVTQTLTAGGTTYFAYNQGKLVQSTVHTKTDVTTAQLTVSNDMKVQIEIEDGPAPAGAEEAFIAR